MGRHDTRHVRPLRPIESSDKGLIAISYVACLTGAMEFSAAFAIFLSVCVLLVTIILWYVLQTQRRGSTILITGICEAGKTQLFSRLCHKRDVVSVTSIKEMSAQYSMGKKTLTVVDLPGHERLRYANFDRYKGQARGIMFLVDSSTIQKDIKDVAEFLYNILCDRDVQSHHLPVLIVCNKQDLPNAKAASLIQKLLEKEINLLRVTKSKQLESVGPSKNNNSFLGYQGEDFLFSHLAPLKVDLVEATVKEGQQLDGIFDWMNNKA